MVENHYKEIFFIIYNLLLYIIGTFLQSPRGILHPKNATAYLFYIQMSEKSTLFLWFLFYSFITWNIWGVWEKVWQYVEGYYTELIYVWGLFCIPTANMYILYIIRKNFSGWTNTVIVGQESLPCEKEGRMRDWWGVVGTDLRTVRRDYREFSDEL